MNKTITYKTFSACFLLLLSTFLPKQLIGHGTITTPSSRVYRVYQDMINGAPNLPSTSAALNHDGGHANAYYTWNQVAKNITPYSGQSATPYIPHIPDGQLASGVSGTGLNFSGLDLVSNDWDWPAQEVASGNLDITWYATATHDPSFFKAWITKADYNHKTPLAWDKLDYLGQVAHTKAGQYYHFSVDLPERSGRHVLYVIWQRIDAAGEAFFSAVDLNFTGGGGGPVLPPAASIADRNIAEDGGSASIPVTLSKSVPSGTSATVDYATSSISATPGSDYIPVTGTLTFSPNQLVKTISIPIIDDALEEVQETFRITLSNPQGLDLGAQVSTVTISDNDAATSGGYSFEKTSDWGSGYQGWFHLSNPGPGSWTNPTLTFDMPPGTGFSYFDGRFSQVTDENGHVTVTGLGTIAEGAELAIDMVVSPAPSPHNGPTNVKINGVPLGGLAPKVSIASVEKSEGDTAGNSVSLTVALASPHTESIHVSYTTSDGTATAGVDYIAKSGIIEFTPGQTQKNITISFNGNLVSEGDKDFFVVLSSVPGENLPNFATGGSQATVTLLDDDSIIGMTATGGTMVEGDSGTKNMTFRFFLDRSVKSGENVSVGYYTHDHGATKDVDYADTFGTLVFPAGSSSGTVTVPIIGDTEDEVLEQFMLHFQSPVGIRLDTFQAVGQIIDNEFDPSAFGGQRVVAYVDGTGGSSSMPPANRVTHICLAFANVNTDGTLSGGGSGSASMKATNPNLKFLLSVGGWTWSYNFSSVAADPVKRAAFAASCRNRCANNNLDGIDLDWEWPGVSGGPGTSPTPQDGHNYTLLVQALRTELDDLETQTGKHYEITAYAPAGAGIGQLELPQLSQLFDFVNVQGYDLHGSWDSRTGHQAGLFHNSADPQSNQLNIDAILKKYLAGGFSKDQLLVGAPFYCQRWYGVADVNNGAFQPGSGGGQVTYRNLQSKIQTMPRFWDDEAKTAFLYDKNTREWISLDDPQSMYEKAKYSLDEGFGGVFYWQHGGDTTDIHLLGTISDTLALNSPGGSGHNHPPTSSDTSGSVSDDASIGTTVTTLIASDSDVDDTLSYVITSGNASNAFTIDASGNITTAATLDYETNPSYMLVVTVTDNGNPSLSDTANVSITVIRSPVNHTPIAGNDFAETNQNTPVIIDVLANDSDPDGDSLTVSSISTPPHGSAIIHVNHTITYTPDSDFSGSDALTYMISDGNGAMATATISILVNSITQGPVAVDDLISTFQALPVSFDPLKNDTDPQGDAFSLDSFEGTTMGGGSVVLAAGSVTNVAVSGIASQSSTAYGGSAFRAIDGDTNGNWRNYSTTHTYSGYNSWWQLELGETLDNLDRMVLFNRSDCCWSRLSDFRVSVFEGTTEVFGKDYFKTGSVGRVASFDIQLPEGTSGDRVRVQINGYNNDNNGYLSLAEVQVWQSSHDQLQYIPEPNFIGTDSFNYTIMNEHGMMDTGLVTITVEERQTPKLFVGAVNNLGSEWTTITLPNLYDSMIVVATPVYESGQPPVVTRIRNAFGNTFEIMLQRIDHSTTAVNDRQAHFFVVEEGVYTEGIDGVTMEATTFTSTQTAGKADWSKFESRSYQNSYGSPVIVGQVMSFNDTRFSQFVATGSSLGSAPTASSLRVSKHTGEDPFRSRTDETIGYVVFESGAGAIDGVPFVANLGADLVRGVGNGIYQYSILGIANATLATLSAAGVDGVDGSIPVLATATPVLGNTIRLTIDEDQLNDSERSHTTEQVAYVAFALPATANVPLAANDMLDVGTQSNRRIGEDSVPTELNVDWESNQLSWTGETGMHYQLQFTVDLVEWLDYGNMQTGTGETLSAEIPNHSSQSFFRLLLIPSQASTTHPVTMGHEWVIQK